jgi:hypothetical protein
VVETGSHLTASSARQLTVALFPGVRTAGTCRKSAREWSIPRLFYSFNFLTIRTCHQGKGNVLLFPRGRYLLHDRDTKHTQPLGMVMLDMFTQLLAAMNTSDLFLGAASSSRHRKGGTLDGGCRCLVACS